MFPLSVCLTNVLIASDMLHLKNDNSEPANAFVAKWPHMLSLQCDLGLHWKLRLHIVSKYDLLSIIWLFCPLKATHLTVLNGSCTCMLTENCTRNCGLCLFGFMRKEQVMMPWWPLLVLCHFLLSNLLPVACIAGSYVWQHACHCLMPIPYISPPGVQL